MSKTGITLRLYTLEGWINQLTGESKVKTKKKPKRKRG